MIYVIFISFCLCLDSSCAERAPRFHCLHAYIIVLLFTKVLHNHDIIHKYKKDH